MLFVVDVQQRIGVVLFVLAPVARIANRRRRAAAVRAGLGLRRGLQLRRGRRRFLVRAGRVGRRVLDHLGHTAVVPGRSGRRRRVGRFATCAMGTLSY